MDFNLKKLHLGISEVTKYEPKVLMTEKYITINIFKLIKHN